MSEKKPHPPQPIPYPEHKITKLLYRFPVLLYRLGLDKLIGKYILILSTTGRKSGKVRRTPLEYFQHDKRYYIISGFGTDTDWYQNLLADPHATINTNHGVLHAKARKPETKHEWDGVMAYLKSSPITALCQPELITQRHEPDVQKTIKTWPVLTFDPTNECCPPPLSADLVWAWPIILLLLALNIFVGWLLINSKNKL